MTVDEWAERLSAVASSPRLRILAELHADRLHVSELARRLGMSRPLLYGHLTKLEQAGFVVGHHEMSSDGRAFKYYALVPFDLHLTPAVVADAVARSSQRGV